MRFKVEIEIKASQQRIEQVRQSIKQLTDEGCYYESDCPDSIETVNLEYREVSYAAALIMMTEIMRRGDAVAFRMEKEL